LSKFCNIKVPLEIVLLIDDLIKSGRYVSRPDYAREVFRNDLRERGKVVNGA